MTDPSVVEQLVRRFDAAAARWRARLRDEILQAGKAPRKPAAAPADFHQQIAEIERELSEAERRLSEERAASEGWERRAIDAIRRSDDVKAKRALGQQLIHHEAAIALESDLEVLRAIADEYRRAMAPFSTRSSSFRH